MKSKKTKVYAVRHYISSLCPQKQPELMNDAYSAFMGTIHGAAAVFVEHIHLYHYWLWVYSPLLTVCMQHHAV